MDVVSKLFTGSISIHKKRLGLTQVQNPKLIGDIWKTWNGSASTDEELCLKYNQSWLWFSLMLFQIFWLQIYPKKWLGLTQICNHRSWFHNRTSLIVHIWKTYDGSAATDEVYCGSEQTSFVSDLTCDVSKHFPGSIPKGDLAWHRCTYQALVSQQNKDWKT